jgi:hypothetical protein
MNKEVRRENIKVKNQIIQHLICNATTNHQSFATPPCNSKHNTKCNTSTTQIFGATHNANTMPMPTQCTIFGQYQQHQYTYIESTINTTPATSG